MTIIKIRMMILNKKAVSLYKKNCWIMEFMMLKLYSDQSIKLQNILTVWAIRI